MKKPARVTNKSRKGDLDVSPSNNGEKVRWYKFRRFHIPITLGIVLLVFSFSVGLLIAAIYFRLQLSSNEGYSQVSPPVTPTNVQKLIVGTDPTYPPMEYKKDGFLVGYDIDLANLIAKELGTTADFKVILFDDLFSALEQGKVDMVISTVTITDERKKMYDISDPYLNAGQVIITRKTDSSIDSSAKLAGKKIGVQSGTTIEKEALKYTDKNLVIRYENYDEVIQALTDGEIDALFTDLPAAKGLITQHPEFRIASDPITNDFYGVVLKKGDPRVAKVNQVIESLRIKGVLADLKQKWLD